MIESDEAIRNINTAKNQVKTWIKTRHHILEQRDNDLKPVLEQFSRVLLRDTSDPEVLAEVRDITGKIAQVVDEIKNQLDKLPSFKMSNNKIQQTIHDDYLVCLIDNAKVKLLTRHIRTQYGIEPELYKSMFNLPDDYPMVPKSTSQAHSKAAKDWHAASRS